MAIVRMMKKVFILSLLVTMCLYCACGKSEDKLKPPQLLSEIAATVNGTKIPLKTVKDLYNQLPDNYRSFYASKKGMKSFVEDLIDRELISQEAQKDSKKWTDLDLSKIKEDFLKQQVVSYYLGIEFESIPPPTEEIAKKYFEDNKSQYPDKSFDSLKDLIRSELLRQQHQKKRDEIVELLRSMESVKIMDENKKYISMKYDEAKQHTKEVIITVNNKPITLDLIMRNYNKEYERIQFHIPNVPEKLVDDLIKTALGDELIYIDGLRRGYDKNPTVISAAEENFNRFITKSYLDTNLKITAEPTKEELQKFYEANKFKFYVPKRYHIRQIMLKLPMKKDPEQEKNANKKALEAQKRLQKGEDFGKVARELTEGPEKSLDGDIGELTIDQMVPEFQAAIQKMKTSEISNIIKTMYGYHIIQLVGEKDQSLPTFEEIESNLREYYQKDQWDKKFGSLIESLRSKAKIEIFENYFVD
jgi:parvulin-like peptidyl-prolyl isomerase